MPLRKNWTILLVPHDNIKVRNFILTRAVIILGAIIVCASLAVMVMLAYGYYHKQIVEAELSSLVHENQALKGKVDTLGDLTAELKTKLRSIEDIEAEYRKIAGLSGIDPEVKEAGIGGPERNGLVREDLATIDKGYADRIMRNEETLNALIRQADILQQSLSESVEQLKYYQDRLNHTPSIWPTVGRLTSRYGGRVHPIFEGIRKHEGIDISAETGMPVVATAEGVVDLARWKLGYGQAVEIDHGFDTKTFYAHLSKIKVKKGQKVSRGEIIGLVGNTGLSTGPHLHYEVKLNGKSKNPLDYILGYSVPD
jgi:murein DD-endopeptidase MepM/ murein hydrolase activator NlpD